MHIFQSMVCFLLLSNRFQASFKNKNTLNSIVHLIKLKIVVFVLDYYWISVSLWVSSLCLTYWWKGLDCFSHSVVCSLWKLVEVSCCFLEKSQHMVTLSPQRGCTSQWDGSETIFRFSQITTSKFVLVCCVFRNATKYCLVNIHQATICICTRKLASCMNNRQLNTSVFKYVLN